MLRTRARRNGNPVLNVTAEAPAKLVLSGEYAVLFGAPAVVLAVDRRVAASVRERTDRCCRLHASGMDRDADFSLVEGKLVFAEPAMAGHFGLAAAVIERLGLPPGGVDLDIDSRALYAGGRKLGLGSSAAVCVALGKALAAASGIALELTSLVEVHRQAQGGRGSGVDIAAAWHSGLLSVTTSSGMPTVDHLSIPGDVALRIVDTGVPASTARMLAELQAWRGADVRAGAALQALGEAARDAEEAWRAGAGERATRGYAAALERFDAASGLGIVSSEHRQLAALAEMAGVAYKPSGAGGGDVGVAVAADPARLAAFDEAAAAAGFATYPAVQSPAEAA